MTTPSDEFGARLEAYLAGDLDEAQRAALEAEALADPELAEQLARAVGLNAALGEARVVPGQMTAPPLRRRRLWPLVASAAAAVIAVVVFWPRDGVSPLPAREPVLRGSASEVQALGPLERLDGPLTAFRWTSAPEARRYRLEIRDEQGRIRHVALVADTVLTREQAAFPAVIDSLSGSLTWQVVPILADGRTGRPSLPVDVALPPPR